MPSRHSIGHKATKRKQRRADIQSALEFIIVIGAILALFAFTGLHF